MQGRDKLLINCKSTKTSEKMQYCVVACVCFFFFFTHKIQLILMKDITINTLVKEEVMKDYITSLNLS